MRNLESEREHLLSAVIDRMRMRNLERERENWSGQNRTGRTDQISRKDSVDSTATEQENSSVSSNALDLHRGLNAALLSFRRLTGE